MEFNTLQLRFDLKLEFAKKIIVGHKLDNPQVPLVLGFQEKI